jgi:hypothetical protein
VSALLDSKDIEVANLATEETASPEPEKTAPSAPAARKHSVLEDKLAALRGDDSHPLDAGEPDDPPEQVEPEPEAAKPANQPKSTDTPSAPSHPADLLAAARNLGIDETHLVPGAVSTQALLDFVVKMRLKDSVLANHKPAAKEPPPAPVDDEEAYFDKLEKEIGVDPTLTTILRKQAKKIKELEGRPDAEEAAKRVVAARDQSVANEKAIDSAFVSLGAKFEKVFGTGALDEMEAGPQKSKRLRVFQSAGIDFAKDSISTIRKKIIDAANDIYGDVIAEPEVAAPAKKPAAGGYGEKAAPTNGATKPNEVKMTKEEWERASLGRPNGKPSKRDQAAKNALHDFYRENNIQFDGGEDPLEGVPE